MTIPSLQKSEECIGQQSSSCYKISSSCNDCNDFKNTSNDESTTNVEFTDLLCYACRVNMRDINVINHKVILPPYVAEGVEEKKRKNNRKQMRKQIEEYLLRGDDDEL